MFDQISSVIILIFFLVAIMFTINYRFIQLKASKIAIKEIFNKNKSKSSYKTFMVMLASHIGTGNIVGITSAILLGGKGSLFWMWIYAIFGSIFSLFENTLAIIFRKNINGEYRGGSSYYIKSALGLKSIPIIISIFLCLSNSIFFQPIQVKTVSEALIYSFNIPRIIIFISLVLFCIFIIFKGTNKIVRFSEIIVPIMSILYVCIGILIIIFNIKIFPKVITEIVTSAFNVKSILSPVIIIGMKRSLFSHEAGLGTTPTISAMNKDILPKNQGFISCFGVFIDTILLCSITGFMILIYDIDLSKFTGIDLIYYVFESIFGKFGNYLCLFFLLTFALATVVSQYYLGESNILFISNNKISKVIFKILFIIGLIIGIYLDNSLVWDFVDTGIILLGIVNISCITIIIKKNKFNYKYYINNNEKFSNK